MKGVRIQFDEGQRFGSLVVVKVHSGRQNRNRSVECLCDCGRTYFVASTRLNRGDVKRCFQCAPWRKSKEAIHFRRSLYNYQHSAGRKNLTFDLTEAEFRKLYETECSYCGTYPSQGVDRKNNLIGYIKDNCTPCCAICNYAKRDMTEENFLSWIARIAAKQGFSL